MHALHFVFYEFMLNNDKENNKFNFMHAKKPIKYDKLFLSCPKWTKPWPNNDINNNIFYVFSFPFFDFEVRHD